MTDRQILDTLAALNPVIDEPDYDEDAERGLVALLETTRAEAMLAPVRARQVARRRLPWLPGWGATISIGATLALAVVVVAGGLGGVGGRGALGGKPAAPAVTHLDAHGLVADRMMAALTVADEYVVRGDELQTDPSGVVHRSVTSTDEQSPINFADLEYSSSGAPSVQETDFAVGGGVVVLKLDNHARQYSETTLTTLQYAHQFGFSSVADLKKSSVSISELIRRELVKGSDRLLGRARLHGRPVLVLANNEPSMHRRIWVDPASYLPVRMTAHAQGMSYVINYTWIRRTEQAVAATFAPHIPPGFTRVSQLTGG
ncbi:MAG: hypothetical protein WAU75_12230 [Solirubrobacteraceae bacterium]